MEVKKTNSDIYDYDWVALITQLLEEINDRSFSRRIYSIIYAYKKHREGDAR